MPPRRRRRWTEKRKPRKPASQTDDWWEVRNIVDERPRGSTVEYLVDWEDDRRTGEPYQPSWVPAADVNEDAIVDWENTKKNRQQEPISSTQPEAPSQDSQPPQPANRRQRQQLNQLVRRRIQDTEDGDRDQQGPRKRGRYETASPSLEPVPSITSSATVETGYEDPPATRTLQQISVELKRDPGFDSSEYYSVRDTQSTAQSSQPLSELESQDRRITISSLLQDTIPDSQDTSSHSNSADQARFQSQTHPGPTCDSIVIPESQDHWQSSAAPVSKAQPRSSVQEYIPASAGSVADIPSHQPDQSSPHKEHISHHQHPILGGSAQPGYSYIARPSPPAETASPLEPVYFTQPNFGSSSHDSQVIPDHCEQHTTGEGPTTVPPPLSAPPETDESRLRISQAAQVYHRDYGISEEEESFSSQPLPSVAGNGTEASNPSSQAPHSQYSTSQEPTRDSSGRGSGKSTRTMSTFKEETQANASSGGSAADELRNLWRETLNDTNTEESQTGYSAAAAELANFGATGSGAGEEQQSSNPAIPVEFYTQPAQASWGGGMTLSDQTISHSIEKPGPSSDQPQQSAADALRDIMSESYQQAIGPSALMPDPMLQVDQPTVSPADVSKPGEAERALTLLPTLSGQDGMSSGPFDTPRDVISMGQVPEPDEAKSTSDEDDSPVTDYIVTLPFQASIRPLYDETLLKYKQEVTKFSEAFSGDDDKPPEDSLIEKMDELLSRLRNLCDYPEDIVGTMIENMTPQNKVKYSLGANAKFNFIYELLQGLRTSTNVLIVARSVNLLRPLCELIEVLDLECSCGEIGYTPKEANRDSIVRVTVSLTDQNHLSPFDLVIGYDSSFNRSKMGLDLELTDTSKKLPLVLRLVTAYTLEHIDLEIDDPSNSLQRKNILLYGMVQCRRLLNDPPRAREPSEIAHAFVEYLNKEVDDVFWEPDSLPSNVLDYYQESDTATQMSPMNAEGGRKRKLDDDEDAESKRMRRFSRVEPQPRLDVPPLTENVRKMLHDAGLESITATLSNESQMPVPISILETLAAKLNEARRAAEAKVSDADHKKVIDQLDQRVKEYEKSIDGLYEKYREALQDRTQFQNQTSKAEAALAAKVDEVRTMEEKHTAKVADLDARIARLTSDPADGSALGVTEKLLQDSRDQIERLEKRLATSHTTEEYIRQSYQDASSTVTSMRSENEELKRQNADLQQKASDNHTKIHEINKQNMAKQFARQIAELQARLNQREAELDRTREELRQIRNGRRETRQVSVPRSPRTGMMSPRPPRVAGSVSRGASPAPVMGAFDAGTSYAPGPVTTGAPGAQYTTTGGNGRWGPGNLR